MHTGQSLWSCPSSPCSGFWSVSASLDGMPDSEITRVGKDLRDLGVEMMRRQQVHGTTTRR